ncbi:hypothetical protein Poly41_25310 [Novipirellula artificiosorum]|uniref:Glycosyl hydrolases family 2, sugar binding domain n=1 Tax=Novipirellula artificiosorum TaxID=2528016 RepID=A0A5C6DTN2_9BACT|nr:hypothetical protein Poly41_25310 [Novipirellula artificiosorum]
MPDPIESTGPWDVSFPENLGTTSNAKFDELISWSTSPDQGIRHFSGTATYQKQFHLPKQLIDPNLSLELDLGNVAVIAHILMNGEDLGILWKAPFRVSLDGCAREGVNHLEVRVTNLWPNRLIGDQQLPGDVEHRGPNVKRWPDWLLNQTQRSSGRFGFPGYQHYQQDSDLIVSGLLGPVTVRSYVEAELYDTQND